MTRSRTEHGDVLGMRRGPHRQRYSDLASRCTDTASRSHRNPKLVAALICMPCTLQSTTIQPDGESRWPHTTPLFTTSILAITVLSSTAPRRYSMDLPSLPA